MGIQREEASYSHTKHRFLEIANFAIDMRQREKTLND
jgi:hypothetical protein